MKKLIKIILIAVVLAGVGYGIYWFLGFSKQQTINNVIDESKVMKPLEENRLKLFDVYPGDKDSDGLSEEKEKELGTSDLSPDTDGDGLDDKTEVEVYKTDPTNTDTDNDGYWDGFEIMGGFNPNGGGKL